MTYVLFIMGFTLSAPAVGVGEYETKQKCEAKVLQVIEHGTFAFCEARPKGFTKR